MTQPATATPPKAIEPASGLAMTSYILYLVSLFIWVVPAIVAVVIAYAGRASATPFLASHYKHQIRIFWISVIGGTLSLMALVAGGIKTGGALDWDDGWNMSVMGTDILHRDVTVQDQQAAHAAAAHDSAASTIAATAALQGAINAVQAAGSDAAALDQAEAALDEARARLDDLKQTQAETAAKDDTTSSADLQAIARAAGALTGAEKSISISVNADDAGITQVTVNGKAVDPKVWAAAAKTLGVALTAAPQNQTIQITQRKTTTQDFAAAGAGIVLLVLGLILCAITYLWVLVASVYGLIKVTNTQPIGTVA
jgi:uncharacterized membrane protein